MLDLAQRIDQFQYRQNQRFQHIALMALSVVPVILLWALNSGAIPINILTMVFSSLESDTAPLHYTILTEIRLPRIIMTFVTGAGLALCGLLLQSICRNPLADPGLIGVSASAALFAGIGFYLLSVTSFSVMPEVMVIPAMAFVGAALAIALLLALTRNALVGDSLILVLTGVAINAGAATLLGLLTFTVDDQTLRQISFWSMGSFAGIDWPIALTSTVIIGLGASFLWCNRHTLMLLSLGEQQAAFQGINVNRSKTMLLLVCALMTAVSVCFTGIVGFVGLIVPHICRMILGSHLRLLMPACVLVGGSLVVVADTLARTIIIPAELPIGLLTSALGVPFFVGLILRAKGRPLYV